MQNPPPGPPPGGQPPSYPPPGGYPPPGQYPPPGYQPSTGLDKKTSVILAYVLGWVTGIIFLFVGKSDPDVKYHAAQSIIFFGSLSVIIVILREIPFAGTLFGFLALLVWAFGFVVWIICLVRASSGGGARFQVPVVGDYVSQYAEQLAAAVN